ncbi:MAG TPA: ATP-dependent helicase, partial [Acidimicrobiales bacterium]|nr:ATP-dependent helicase [Acidimicrobiales bacterium]
MDRRVLDIFGRGVVVLPDGPVPGAWLGCQRIVVGPTALTEPAGPVAELHEAWLARTPVVVELGVATEQLRAPERWEGPVYELAADFAFLRERLQFLVWANTYDGRPAGEPVWWHGRKAARQWAPRGVAEGGPADLVLADGSALYVDGGPSHPPPWPDGTATVHRWNAEAGILRPAGHETPDSAAVTGTLLAPDQRAAVLHPAGPARVIAPAGSGKTRVLTERLRQLVVGRGVDPGSVTALAFNTKAAEELRERCADFGADVGPHIRTLNSLGLWICNRFGGGGRLQVFDELRARAAVEQVFEIRRQANTDTVAPYLEGLSAIRLGLSAPGEAEEQFPDAAGLAGGFDRYRNLLAESWAVDFDEQIYRAIELLLTDPEAREQAQRRCRYLLVDEFQDLTPAHVLLIRILSAPGYDCFGVGDDDQVIYGYSGADPAFLLDYDRYFPGATSHALEVSYRCPPAVVDGARNLLSYNHRRVPKSIRSGRGGPGEPGALAVHRAPAEQLAGATVGLLEGWLADGVEAGEVAVLARVNSALLPVQVACTEAGVPCTTPLGPEVLRRTGVRTALAYLRIGLDPGRIAAADFTETVRRPSRGIAPKVAEMVTRGPETSVRDIRRLAGRLTGRDVPKLESYAADVDRLAEACHRSTAEALRTIRLEIGLGDTMEVLDSSRREVDRSTHADDLVALESVAALHPEVEGFERWLRSTLARSPGPAGGPGPGEPGEDSPAGGPRVLLSTVHRIKGREWDRVVVFGASAGQFPHRLSDDEEGERRVFHVALTRGRQQVVVMAAEEAPSIFVAELDGSRSHSPAPVPGAEGGRGSAGERSRATRADRTRRGRRPGAPRATPEGP